MGIRFCHEISKTDWFSADILGTYEWCLEVCQLVRCDCFQHVYRVYVKVLLAGRVKHLPQTVADVCHHGRDQQLVGQADEDDHDGQSEIGRDFRCDIKANHACPEEDLQHRDGEGV